MEITFESVSKQYKSKYALKNFTATLSEGVYGLLGENVPRYEQKTLSIT